MIINYTDIANESESITFDTSGLDAGTAAFMTWFQECAEANGITIRETIYAHMLCANGSPRDYGDFDFSASPTFNLNDKALELENNMCIRAHYTDRHSKYDAESAHYVHKGIETEDCMFFVGLTDSDAAELHVEMSTEDNLIYPEIYIHKPYPASTEWRQLGHRRYEAYKTLIGNPIETDPRYGVNLIHLTKLNITANNKIETVNSVTF